MKSQPGRQRWVAGALRAGRAAAFLTLATGINGTIAALEPRYEPIYVYLIAIVVVAWLGGALLGVTTAVAAVILYDTMFAPVERFTPSWSIVPLVVAVGAAVMTHLARAPLKKQELPVVVPPPLLETTVPTVVSVSPAADPREFATLRNQLEDFREQLAEAGRQADEARLVAEKESRLRMESAASARARLAGLQHELDAARNDALEQAKRAAALQSQIEELTRRADQSGTKLPALEREVETARNHALETETKLNSTLQELEVAWRRVDEEKARADAEGRRLEELERKANAALEQAIAELAERYEGPLAEAKKSLADAFTRIPQLEKERSGAAARAAELHSETERLRIAITERENEREAARAELRGLRNQLASIQDRMSAQSEELRAANARAGSLEQRAEGLEQDLEQTRSHLEIERSQRERLEADVDRKIESIVTGLTSDYEDSLGQAMVDREAARAEIRGLTAKVEALQKKLAEADRGAEIERLEKELDETRVRAEAERMEHERDRRELDAKIASIAAGLTSDYEESLGQAMVDKEAAKAEIRSLTARIEVLQSKLADERAKAEAQRNEVDAKIASIAAGLTHDYEESLGQALVDKEAAKAEIRSLAGKVEALQKKLSEADRTPEIMRLQAELDDARAKASAASEDVGNFVAQIATLKTNLDEARDARARNREEIDRLQQQLQQERAEFDTKIASIVKGITNDHESAIGEAMVEKEAARAELRAVTKKLEAEKKRVEDEKAAREKLDAEWSAKLQTIVNHLASDHESDLGEAMLAKEEARAEARDLNIRLKSLQQKLELEREQHRQTLQLLSAQRETPPAVQGRSASGVVLVVHSDAGTRAMCKHALEQSGHTVLTAGDGLEALRVASTQRPDIVLAESILPKLNGRELVQLLKARTDTANVKIVLMSSGAHADNASDFRADDYLDSPADFTRMREILTALLTPPAHP